MRRLSLLPGLLSVTAALLAGCPDAPAGGTPREGEGEEGEEGEGDEGEGDEGEEGEGEEGEGDEGEGEPPLPTPTATVTVSPRFAVPADGTTAVHVDVFLAGAAIADRVVDVATVEAGPVDVSGVVSDATGHAGVDLRSTVDGDFDLVVTVDGVVVDVSVEDADGVRVPPRVRFSTCTSLEETFTHDAWPVVFSRCIGCHNEFGYAPSLGARFVLPLPGDDDFAGKGVAAVRAILEDAGTFDIDVDSLSDEQRAALLLEEGETALPLVLANPTLAEFTGHTGGVVLAPDEVEEIARFRGFLARLQNGDDTCGAGSDNGVADEDLLDGTTLLSLKETFKKASLALRGTNASGTVLNTIVDEATLGTAIDDLLADKRVETRMGEIWNDWLLTDDTIGSSPNQLGNAFPDRMFFEPLRSEVNNPSGNNSCDDRIAGNCCRVPEDPLNLDDNDDNDVPPKAQNVACEQKRQELRRSYGREPVEIFLRIWRDGLPASEAVVGEFTVVDPALARAYGLLAENGRTFLDGDTQAFNASTADDGVERRAVRLVDTDENDVQLRTQLDTWPHQGIFSTPSFLRRYPTTTSNRERTRARFVYERLLGVPVMKLAAFATPEIPPGQSLENLTWDTQPCVVCHTLLDPVAATFNHWPSASGTSGIGRACRNEGMRQPGFGIVELPGEGIVIRPALDDFDDCNAGLDGSGVGRNDRRGPARLAWLGDRVVEHPRFAYAMVTPIFEGLVGTPIASAPDALIDPDFTAKARAFASQQKELARLVAAFRAGEQRFKPLVKAILLSKSFRAVSTAAAVDADADRALELLGVGDRGLLLTPETLDRRITSLFGLPWTRLRNPNSGNNLTTETAYPIFFGGIDSDTVTLRSRDPVAIRAAIAHRLGNEMSCVGVPQEFSIVDPTQRKLFRDVELTDVPLDADGNVIADVDARVVTQIQRLHRGFWNEETLDAAEVEASHQLFLDALRAMRAGDNGTPTPTSLGACAATAQFIKVAAGETRPAYPATGTVVIGDVEHRRVSTDPQFVVRAWMAVTASLMADGRFLFE